MYILYVSMVIIRDNSIDNLHVSYLFVVHYEAVHTILYYTIRDVTQLRSTNFSSSGKPYKALLYEKGYSLKNKKCKRKEYVCAWIYNYLRESFTGVH